LELYSCALHQYNSGTKQQYNYAQPPSKFTVILHVTKQFMFTASKEKPDKSVRVTF